ncbi:MAG TPA: fibronectin type III domain-containing protein [Kofleriaceae bacterium]|nr:fibronectin type III domain-containing protein [Kofleriaceae bacterium]
MVLLAMVTSCTLDPAGKLECQTKDDCLADHVCREQRCVMDVPDVPTGLTATPSNGTVLLSWTPSLGATGYVVYYGSNPALTATDASVPASMSSATVPGLTNGTAQWFAVVAIKSGAISALSPVVCAVPTASDIFGLTLHDSLCAGGLDGAKWLATGGLAGAYRVGVVGGAAVITLSMDNQESRLQRGVLYNARPVVNVSAGTRVTSIAADVTVPGETVTVKGASTVVAGVRLVYQPPARRLSFPGANQDTLIAESGLLIDAQGIKAYRQVSHCDEPSCGTISNTQLFFNDPVEWTVSGNRAVAPAAYDTTYRVSVTLDEAEIVHVGISGGSFGVGVSGTADPVQYLRSTPGWASINLIDNGFLVAQMGVATFDNSTTGGGSSSIGARFDNVEVGINGAAPTTWDDFGGTGENSGPTGLSLSKWANGGSNEIDASPGKLTLRQIAPAGTVVAPLNPLFVSSPSPINTIQVDVSGLSTTGSLSRVLVQGRFYNDGFVGTTAPDVNALNSAVGDVFAGIVLIPGATPPTMQYSVIRCKTAGCTGPAEPVASGPIGDGTLGPGAIHPVRVKWNPTTQHFIFSVDDQSATVDPTAVAPVNGPPNAPLIRIATVAAPVDAMEMPQIRASVTNVFTAP